MLNRHLLLGAACAAIATGLSLSLPASAVAGNTGLTDGAIASPAPIAIPAANPRAEEAEEDAAEDKAIEGWDSEEEEEEDAEQEGDDEEDKTLEEYVADFEMIEGMFTFYRNREDGELYMAVNADQFEREYIYFSHMLNGSPSVIAFAGMYRFTGVFSLRRHYDRVELQFENTNYYFDPDNALSRAKDANISPALAHVTKVEATSEDGNTVLIPVTKLFISADLDPVKFSFPDFEPPFGLGKRDEKKSKVTDVRGYERNVDVVGEYTFNGKASALFGPVPGGITDPRYVTLRLQHSFIEMPEEGFTPRIADQRVGFFTDRVTDQTATDDVTPYRDLVQRWRLVPQDPDADVSDPVEPIVWWIENTTPVEYREAVREGTLRWNEAFEAAGISNAIVVRQQPDDADWDAGDIDKNVLRWTSSPNPPFGGYGPSFTNPRTGEIVGADIMLELVYVTNRMRLSDIYGTQALNALMPQKHEGVERAVEAVSAVGLLADEDMLREAVKDTGHTAHHPGFAHHLAHHKGCQFGLHQAFELSAGLDILQTSGASEEEMAELVNQAIYELVLHEVGHTLGLSHNMKASQLHGPDEIHDKDVTGEVVVGSVMDYSTVNLAPEGKEQGQYYTTRPGPYDTWAIQFGYTPSLDEEGRATLLAGSTKPELAFGNDADDMRSAGGGGIDPRVMINDLSSDALAYSIARMGLINSTLDELQASFTKPGETWAGMRDAYMRLWTSRWRNGLNMANYVGGVQVERFVAGQEGSDNLTPYTPVPLDFQKSAVQNLRENLFAPSAFEVDPELARHMQAERRGFDFFGGGEDMKFHEMIRLAQDVSLAQLTSPFTMRRVVNSTLYGNEYPAIDFLSDLTKAVFEDDAQTDVNTIRQNLQIRYVTRLIVMLITPFYDDVSKSAALASLREVKSILSPPFFGIGAPTLNAETKAHRRHVQLLLRAVGIN